MRIALIHVAQETNDFNPQPTTLRDYEAFGLYEGAEIAAKAGQFGQIGGHFQAIKDSRPCSGRRPDRHRDPSVLPG